MDGKQLFNEFSSSSSPGFICWQKRYPSFAQYVPQRIGSMPFCVELDNLKDTDAPIHQPAAMLVAAD